MLATKNIYIQSAYQTLQVISQDDQKRLEYEAREKAIRDYNQGMLEAREQGRQEGKQEGRQEGQKETKTVIAKNMIAAGLPADIISQTTELSLAQIEQLSKE